MEHSLYGDRELRGLRTETTTGISKQYRTEYSTVHCTAYREHSMGLDITSIIAMQHSHIWYFSQFPVGIEKILNMLLVLIKRYNYRERE